MKKSKMTRLIGKMNWEDYVFIIRVMKKLGYKDFVRVGKLLLKFKEVFDLEIVENE